MRYSFLLFLCLAGCGRPNSPSDIKVINGEKTKAPSYFATVHYKGDRTPYCGGTFIERDVVLTAAHCVSGLTREIEIRQAPSSLDHLPRALAVEGIRVHPRYHKSQITFDIALIYLAQETSSKPLSLGQARSAPEFRVYGFGAMDSQARPEDFPRDLQTALLKEIPIYECQALNRAFESLDSTQICAADFDEGRDSCFGDSGGPLVSSENEELYGIVSWGIACGRKDSPGIYTRVAPFKDWIKGGLKDLDLGEMLGLAYYFPLDLTIGGESLRFTALHHLWREDKEGNRGKALARWKRSFRHQSYELELYPERSGRYILRLSFKGKIYISSASFSRRPLGSN